MHYISYAFVATIWQHSAQGGWHFVSLPPEIAKEIRQSLGNLEEGWGRLKVRATIAANTWDTAIWFDTKADTYLLPIKATIRKTNSLQIGDEVAVIISI